MPEADWVEQSLAGDLDTANRIQYREAIAARTDLPTVKEALEDYLPDKRVPAPPCPGFERLAKVMDIKADEPEEDLATYKPVWSSSWAAAMIQLDEDEV